MLLSPSAVVHVTARCTGPLQTGRCRCQPLGISLHRNFPLQQNTWCNAVPGRSISPLSVPVSCSVRVPTKHEVGGGWCQLRLVGAQSCYVRVEATVGAGHGEVSSVSHRDFQLHSGRDHCSNMMQLFHRPCTPHTWRGTLEC